MARLKLNANHYTAAVARASALKSIDPNLDLGNGLTLAQYEANVETLRQKMNAYNTALSQVDELLNQTQALNTALKDLSERMLLGVAARFGKNSNEYEKAGGTRKSERKKTIKKP